MKTPSRLLLLLALATCSPSETQPPEPVAVAENGIINGTPAGGQWPAAGALCVRQGSYIGQFCSGTLIQQNWVLTAGHCVDLTKLPFPVTQIVFFVGDDTINGPNLAHAYQADAVYPHPNYDSATVQNDIGLLHLSATVPSSVATPIAYNTSAVSSGQAITEIGYGLNVSDGTGGESSTGGGTGSGIKRYANAAIASVSTTTYGVNKNAQNQHTCFGDSGGPDLNSSLKVTGVHSTVNSDWCNNGSTSTRVDYYASWINSHIGPQYPLGHSCSASAPGDCASGFCADGVCCDTNCAQDCQACSVAAGGTANGTCGPANNVACDDLNPCTTGDKCVTGACHGTPKDCGAAVSCHYSNSCNLGTGSCVNGAALPDNTSCDDGNPVTVNDHCVSGVCIGTASTQCQGKADGTACDDGNKCTLNDQCASSVCQPGTAKTCPATGCLTAGTCDVATGNCTGGTPAADGTACDDGNKCTVTDKCVSGTCVGTAKNCSASCKVGGTCDSATGNCTGGTNATNGTACDDGNLCTTGDTCQGGVCQAGTTKTCPPSDPCMQAATCNTATGLCGTYPTLPDNTSCDDGNPCTLGDRCLSGHCTAAQLKSCPAPDACHTAGQCDTGTGACGNYPVVANGTACNDFNACTTLDQCTNGTCQGTPTAAACAATACNTGGQCNASTGKCDGTNKPDGTACDDGDANTDYDQCTAGLCKGTPKGVDPCYGKADGTLCDDKDPNTTGDKCTSQVCKGTPIGTGACAGKSDGTVCDDNDLCTRTDICLSGKCTGTNPMICAAPKACQKAGQCDWQTGSCVYAALPNGTTCDDGDPNTTGDHCQNGKCVGTAVTPGDECQGQADGTACTGGTCTAGACVPTTAPTSPGCGCGTAGASPASTLILLCVGALVLVRRRRG